MSHTTQCPHCGGTGDTGRNAMERVWDACILCDGSGEVEFVTTTEVRQAAQETITAWPGTKTNLYMITYAVFGLLQRLGVNIDFRISTSED